MSVVCMILLQMVSFIKTALNDFKLLNTFLSDLCNLSTLVPWPKASQLYSDANFEQLTQGTQLSSFWTDYVSCSYLMTATEGAWRNAWYL